MNNYQAALTEKSLVVIPLVLIWSVMALLLRADAKLSHRTWRIALSGSVAFSAALLAWSFWMTPQPQPSDLGQVWAGARALLHHQNPYDAVGPGRAFEWPLPLLYPLTAMVAIVPLAALPLRWVDPMFVGLGFGVFTWAVTRRTLWSPALVALVSLPALMALQTSQWSLVLTGAALLPASGWLLAAKPTVGAALFVASPHWKTAIGCAVLLIVSFAVWPGWVVHWRATFETAPHVVAPIMRTGGPLLLLAALKWRRAEARLLLALACVPHTTSLYETIPLFLIPQSWLEAGALWTLSLLANEGRRMSGPYASPLAYYTSGAQWIVWMMYLPCLAMVLRRPNESVPCLHVRKAAGTAHPGAAAASTLCPASATIQASARART
jgi:hypothetical protein